MLTVARSAYYERFGRSAEDVLERSNITYAISVTSFVADPERHKLTPNSFSRGANVNPAPGMYLIREGMGLTARYVVVQNDDVFQRTTERD